jgi:hypothetical protein
MNRPPTLVCPRATSRPPLDDLDHPTWQAAPWITNWINIIGDEVNTSDIRAKLLWDSQNLYLAAKLKEPDLWAFQTNHDGDIWLDNAFELFLDPDGDGHNYFEWEINPIGAILDMTMDRPYVNGGTRNNSFEVTNLDLHLQAHGTVNDPSSIDTGWEFAAAFPWSAFESIGLNEPPTLGDIYRFNLMKMFWPIEVRDGLYHKLEDGNERYWCYGPTHMMDIHRPWFWPYLQFAESSHDIDYQDPDWDTKFDLCRSLALDSRPRSQTNFPARDIILHPTQKVAEHPTGYAVESRGYHITALGELALIDP